MSHEHLMDCAVFTSTSYHGAIEGSVRSLRILATECSTTIRLLHQNLLIVLLDLSISNRVFFWSSGIDSPVTRVEQPWPWLWHYLWEHYLGSLHGASRVSET